MFLGKRDETVAELYVPKTIADEGGLKPCTNQRIWCELARCMLISSDIKQRVTMEVANASNAIHVQALLTNHSLSLSFQ